MAEVNVHWRHESFSHDAGERSNAETDFSAHDAARTGVLTDEHQEVADDRPVLVEEATGRVYRADDLPPDTTVHVPDLVEPVPALVENARRAGFHIRPK